MPAGVYCGTLYPVAWLRALIHSCIKRPPSIPWPEGLPGLKPVRRSRLYRLPAYLNRTFEYIPDRVSRPKWRDYVRYGGLERVLGLVESGRPVVLVFAHFGPYEQLRLWLRGGGLAVTMFAGGTAEDRSALKRRKDAWSLRPEVAATFHRDQLAEAVRHLKADRPLAMSIDSTSARDIQVPAGGGWCFRMPTGAIRLARRHGAALVPCWTYNEGPWRVVVQLGAPVESVRLKVSDAAIGEELLGAMLPIWLARPGEWTPQLAASFSKGTMGSGLDRRE